MFIGNTSTSPFFFTPLRRGAQHELHVSSFNRCLREGELRDVLIQEDVQAHDGLLEPEALNPPRASPQAKGERRRRARAHPKRSLHWGGLISHDSGMGRAWETGSSKAPSKKEAGALPKWPKSPNLPFAATRVALHKRSPLNGHLRGWTCFWASRLWRFHGLAFPKSREAAPGTKPEAAYPQMPALLTPICNWVVHRTKSMFLVAFAQANPFEWHLPNNEALNSAVLASLALL